MKVSEVRRVLNVYVFISVFIYVWICIFFHKDTFAVDASSRAELLELIVPVSVGYLTPIYRHNAKYLKENKDPELNIDRWSLLWPPVFSLLLIVGSLVYERVVTAENAAQGTFEYVHDAFVAAALILGITMGPLMVKVFSEEQHPSEPAAEDPHHSKPTTMSQEPKKGSRQSESQNQLSSADDEPAGGQAASDQNEDPNASPPPAPDT